METIVEVALGETARLPCKCGKWNFDSNNPPKWMNSRGEELVLTGAKVNTIPPNKRKYVLNNDLWWIKVKGDCTLIVHNTTREDQGAYTCTYLEPEFKFAPLQGQWEERYITRKVILMIEGSESVTSLMIAEEIRGSPTTTASERVTNRQLLTTETAMSTSAVTPSKQGGTIDHSEGDKLGEDLSSVEQERKLNVEDDLMNAADLGEDLTEHYHDLQKREAQWKAFGFDSSTLQIADPLASRNLWFQQITHSVRAVKKLRCPCVVKVTTPGTWPSILETVPEPLAVKCQSYALSWLYYQQQAMEDRILALSVHLFKPRFDCSWLMDLPYINLLDQHEDVTGAVPDEMVVRSVKARSCFCSNDTHNSLGMFMGISDCENYMMQFNNQHPSTDNMHLVTFHASNHKQSKTLLVKNQTLPANVTIGNFRDVWWICGNKAYLFLPYGWTGCCYMATLKLPYEVLGAPNEVDFIEDQRGNVRRKREMAQFHTMHAFHHRVSLAEKWGIGLLPWYGVTFLADHIDNITYTLQAFANQTMNGFELLSNTQRSHRLTLLKHDMALDYILAKQGGLCVALNLTGDACYTLIPDNSDNMTNVIEALRNIRDAFGASKNAGWSANAWLQNKFGPMGAMLAQISIAVVISLCVMFCFCTLVLTFAKAMILRWVGVVMPGDHVQMSLLKGEYTENGKDEVKDVELMETYPF